MIFDVEQTSSALATDSFQIVCSGQIIAQANSTGGIARGAVWKICFLHQTFCLIPQLFIQNSNLFRSRADKLWYPYLLQNDTGQEVGRLCQRLSEGSILNRFNYLELSVYGATYQLYIIGLGKEGYRFPIYRGDTQIALIEKDCVVRNNLEIYHVFCLRENDFTATALLCFYLDEISFARHGQEARTSYENSFLITTNKLLKQKYDPSFKVGVR